MIIPFLSLNEVHKPINYELIEAFRDVLDSSSFVLGKCLTQFEGLWSEYLGAEFSVGVSNGLDGLILALKALDVSEGDEVLVPSHTYVASWLAVSHVGAIPVPVEVNLHTGLLDIESLADKVTPLTKAIMAVHLYGQSVNMEGVMRVSRDHGLSVIEDNAQAQGSSWNGKRTGSWGHANSTSFYPGKNLGALGDAGAVTTDDSEIARSVRLLRNYGSEKKYMNLEMGFNMRLDELQAAFLSVKLGHLDAWTVERKRLALAYNEGLRGLVDLELPVVAEGADHVYHLYVVRTKHRESLSAYLNSNGIGTLIHYPIPPHLQECYVHLGYRAGDFPIAEELAKTVLSLPLYPGLKDVEQGYIIRHVKQFFRG